MGTARQTTFETLFAQGANKPLGQGAMILMVGEPQRMQTLKKHFPDRSGIFFIEYADLTKDIFTSMQPDSVIAPVISDAFDCLELAAFLVAQDFKGIFRVIARDLPRPEIVRNEVRALYPTLDFDVIKPEPVSRPSLALH